VDYIEKNNCSFGAVTFGDHGFSDLPADRRLGPACWDCFDLFCVHRGEVTILLESVGEHRLRRGEGMLIFPGTPFRQHAGRRGARVSVQHFRPSADPTEPLPESLRRLRDRAHGAVPVRFDTHPLLDADIERAIDFAYLPASRMLYDLRVAQLLLILGQLGYDDPRLSGLQREPRVLQLQRRLEGVREIHAITPGDMADWVGLSPSRFRVWFKQQFGMPPKQFLTRRRMSQAMRLLRETEQPIKAVARHTGYGDLSTFYHAFRKHTGTTPVTYRQRHVVIG